MSLRRVWLQSTSAIESVVLLGNSFFPSAATKELKSSWRGTVFGFLRCLERQSFQLCGCTLPGGASAVLSFSEEAVSGLHLYCYNVRKESSFRSTGNVGVDGNSVGAVATLADPQNGKVLHLGFNPARTKEAWRGRKANLQSLGKHRLLHKIRNIQARRTKYENHVVSKQRVDYAAKHRRTIVLEKLGNVRRGRIRHYSEKSQWSFYQLLQYILYKAALRGVMVLEVDSAYTSQERSRCHQISKPNGKSFRCGYCGHNDHRDANAAFTLAERVSPIGGVAQESECLRSALLVEPFLGTEVRAMRLGKQNLRACPESIKINDHGR